MPLKAAVIEGTLGAYRVPCERSEMLGDLQMIQAMIDLAKTAQCGLPKVTPADLAGTTVSLQGEAGVEGAGPIVLGIRERARRGELTGEDMR